jgi:hypothetical protein
VEGENCGRMSSGEDVFNAAVDSANQKALRYGRCLLGMEDFNPNFERLQKSCCLDRDFSSGTELRCKMHSDNYKDDQQSF